MKQVIISCFIILAALSSCNTGEGNSSAQTDGPSASDDRANTSYTPPLGVDPKVSASIKDMIDGYLHLKNALTKDDGKDAAAAGAHIIEAMGKIDTVSMNSVQKQVYKEVADDIYEHAGHINENAGKIAHQREHFEMLGNYIEALVKTFGGGQQLFKDFCPMAFDGKGATWLSEFKEIKNPYYGSEMMECGEIKEELK